MRVLNQLARAEVSSDLAHHSRHCDVDVLGAAGMASTGNFAHLALFRLKYLNDSVEIDSAKRLFVMWARKSMIDRSMNPASASRLGTQALTAWVNDVCQPCHGLGYKKVAGAPALSDRACPHCNGTGRNPITHAGADAEVVRDLMERADSVMEFIRRRIGDKLGVANSR